MPRYVSFYVNYVDETAGFSFVFVFTLAGATQQKCCKSKQNEVGLDVIESAERAKRRFDFIITYVGKFYGIKFFVLYFIIFRHNLKQHVKH